MTKVIAGTGCNEGSGDIAAALCREIFSTRLAAALATVAIVLLVGIAWNAQHDQVQRREAERAEHLGRAFEFHVHHELQGVDDLLRQMRRMRLDTPRGFAEAIDELRAGELGQRSIEFAFIDLDGHLRYTTAHGEATQRTFLGERDYFAAHLAAGPDRLFVGRLARGVLSGNSVIHFSRRHVDAAGRLLGVVAISMPAGFLTDGVATLGLRPDDVATILRQDGYLLSRTPPVPDSARQFDRLPADFMTRFELGPAGVFEAPSPVDGQPRQIAFRRIEEFPVIAVVGQHTRARDRELHQVAWRHLALGLMAIGLLLAYQVSHERTLRRNGELRRERERERQHLNEAQAIANIGSWRLDVPRRSLYWSDEVYRIFGLRPDGTRFDYATFLGFVHPDDRLALEATVGAAREDGLPYRIRHRIVRPDGSIRQVVQRGQVVFDRLGLVDQLTGTLQDITEAFEAETRLVAAARSDRLARAVFDGVTQPMCVLSAEGRLVDVNPAFEQAFAVSGAEWRGRPLVELEETPAGARAFANRPSHLFVGGRPADEWQGDIALPAAGGGERVLSLCLSGIRDADGRVEHYVGIYTDVTLRKRREDDAAYQARHDALTTLPNRQYALERMARSLHRARRRRHKGVLIFIDLDRFKEINDSYGHDAGDEVLRVIARRFQAAVRQEDMVARLGGDEFVALIEEVTSPEVVRRIAESIRAAAAEPVAWSNGSQLGISASLGIAIFPQPDETVEALLERADRAMYSAKRDGRDAIRVWAGGTGGTDGADSADSEFEAVFTAAGTDPAAPPSTGSVAQTS